MNAFSRSPPLFKVTSTMEKLYEGKAKAVYTTDTTGVLIQRFKDSATAFNAEKKAEFAGKGELNNRIASMVFRYLESKGVSSHYLDTVNKRDMRIRQVEIIALEVVTRNIVAGSLSKRLGLPEGTVLESPIVEFYYKDDALGDPLFTEDHIRIMKLAEPEDLAELRRQALLVNEALIELWTKCDLKLVDFKLEFGRPATGEILLADEISPDTQRLWTADGRKMDKDVFRRDLGDLVGTYQEVYDRLLKNFPELDLGELAECEV